MSPGVAAGGPGRGVARAGRSVGPDIRALITRMCRRAGLEGALAAFAAQELAERIRDQRRASAHRRLLSREEAEAEADAVHSTVLRSSRGHQAAQPPPTTPVTAPPTTCCTRSSDRCRPLVPEQRQADLPGDESVELPRDSS
jgi:hypothetical protein